MSVSLARLRKRAAELEQKKQFDKALEVYMQILDEGGKDLEDEDVPLFNRVGDMLMRKGSVTEALGYYERAVDFYAERGFLNNAIALCSKILRQSPGRAAVYYKLARISAKKGFKSDARKNFLEYADRMQKLGMAEEAFRALKEFAALYPDQDDVRLVLAELLSKENRKGEALEQLQSLYEKLNAEGRAAEARATIDRMRAIDPSVTPREGTGSQPVAPAGDLVFLDLDDGDAAAGNGTAAPASARAPVPTPVPALSGLSITFVPTEAAPHPEGFETTAITPESVETTPVTRSLTPLGTELVVEPARTSRSLPNIEAIVPFDALGDEDRQEEPQQDPPEGAREEPQAAAVAEAEPAAEMEMLDDLLPEVIEPPPKRPETPRSSTPMSGLEFANIELDEAPRELVHREHDLSLPGTLPDTPEETPAVPPAPSPASDAAGEDARAAAAEAAALKADMEMREAMLASQTRTPPPAPPPVPERSETPPEVHEFEPLAVDQEESKEPVEVESIDTSLNDDFMAMAPSFGVAADTTGEHAFPPLPGLADSALDQEVAEAAAEAVAQAEAEEAARELRMATPRATLSIGSAEAHLRRRLELEPENWELRRQLGEALLDTGDRDGGLYELELAMVGFELLGDIERAQEVVDEILGVFPASVGHHQKRVEYAVRTRDRMRLSNSYLELADALFRTGAGDKAVAVYSRVLELDRGNERAEFALSTLAPDALVRLREKPAEEQPSRWTEEMDAIEGGAEEKAEAQPVVDESSPAPVSEAAPVVEREAAVEAEAVEAAVPDESVQKPVVESQARGVILAVEGQTPKDTPVESIELPDPDWGEGIPTPAPERFAPPPDLQEVVDEFLAVDEPAAAMSEPEAAPFEPEAVAMESETAAAPEAPFDTFEIEEPPPPVAPRKPTPARASTPTFSRLTPRANPSIAQAREAARRLTPAIASDSDFVDLGDWLRTAEPTRSTRMQVEDPRPTGDEQADFEELLRRFKRGVAENVEAEDYEAHYDLGVAFKEMGLVDEAIAQFQKSLRGETHRVRSYEALGQCFVEQEKYPIAAALLQRATESRGADDQQLVGVLYLLGFALEHQGRPADALPYYLRVFAVDIEFRDVAARVAALGNPTK